MTARRRRGDDEDLIGSIRATTAVGAAAYVIVVLSLSICHRHQNQPYTYPFPLLHITEPRPLPHYSLDDLPLTSFPFF